MKSAFMSCMSPKLRTHESSCDATPPLKNHYKADQDRDDIPWPVLTKSTPGRLKRTASSLMNEWERSLAAEIQDKPDPLVNSTSGNNETG